MTPSKKCIYTARHETCYDKWVDFTPLSPDERAQLKVDEGAQEKEERRKEIEQKFIDAEAPIEELAEPGGYGTHLDTEGRYERSFRSAVHTHNSLWVQSAPSMHADTRYTEASRNMDRQLHEVHLRMELAKARMRMDSIRRGPIPDYLSLPARLDSAMRSKMIDEYISKYNDIESEPGTQSRPYQSRRFFREED